MISVLTGLVLRLGTAGKDGHTRGIIGFTAGHIYRACLDYRYGSGVVYDISVLTRLSPWTLIGWAQWVTGLRSHKGCHGILPGTDLQIVLA